MPARSKVAQAVMELREAQVKRARAEQFASWGDPVGRFYQRKDAEQLEASAEAVLMQQVGEVPVTRGMGDVAPIYLPEGTAIVDRQIARSLSDSLTNPGMVEAQAALERSRLLMELGSLEMSLDLQKTIDVRNSIERLLCGEMASAHVTALTLLHQAQQWAARAGHDDHYWREYTQESTRLVNASARLMSSVNEAALTLQKLRQGGRQEVHVVQHVQVDGGQAVVAGAVTTGGTRSNGGGEENRGTMPWTQSAHLPGTPTCNEPMPPRVVVPKPAKKRTVKAQPSGGNGVAACTVDTSPEPLEATDTP
jgi:hypothetical protein